jgi:trans-2,3-dihydro-3-hydroxyanthranilate isomerase
MRRYRYLTADVFTEVPFGGNQLAVVLAASDLQQSEMRALAAEFNYSETTFVLPPQDASHAARIRIFTPGRELPFAGHPTIGTALALAWAGELTLAGEVTDIVLEEGVGPVPVKIFAEGGVARRAELSSPRLPEPGPVPPTGVAQMLGLDAEDLDPATPPQAWSCGVPFLVVAVRDRSVLARAALASDLWRDTLSQWWATQVLVICRDAERPGSDLRARMFAPAMGIVEDPATGAAAAALAGLLATEARGEGSHTWRMEQGFEMGRPSLLDITVDMRADAISAVRVAGAAVAMCDGTVSLSDSP